MITKEIIKNCFRRGFDMKKVLCLLMSFMLIFTLFPSIGFAVGDESSDQVEQEVVDYDNQEIFELESLDDAFAVSYTHLRAHET